MEGYITILVEYLFVNDQTCRLPRIRKLTTACRFVDFSEHRLIAQPICTYLAGGQAGCGYCFIDL